MSAGHGKAQRVQHHGVGIDWSPNAVAQDDIALAGLFTPCNQDAVLTSCLCKQMTGSSKGRCPPGTREMPLRQRQAPFRQRETVSGE